MTCYDQSMRARIGRLNHFIGFSDLKEIFLKTSHITQQLDDDVRLPPPSSLSELHPLNLSTELKIWVSIEAQSISSSITVLTRDRKSSHVHRNYIRKLEKAFQANDLFW
jgi:hypothetical protein